jgi:hypothetical protein
MGSPPMTAPPPLAAITAVGGRFEVRGNRLRLTALTALSAAVVENAFTEARDWHHRHREALAHWRALHSEPPRPHRSLGERCRTAGTGSTARASRNGNAPDAASRSAATRRCRWMMALACISTMCADSISSSTYGDRWRSAATRALAAMGLKAPADDEGRGCGKISP